MKSTTRRMVLSFLANRNPQYILSTEVAVLTNHSALPPYLFHAGRSNLTGKPEDIYPKQHSCGDDWSGSKMLTKFETKSARVKGECVCCKRLLSLWRGVRGRGVVCLYRMPGPSGPTWHSALRPRRPIRLASRPNLPLTTSFQTQFNVK